MNKGKIAGIIVSAAVFGFFYLIFTNTLLIFEAFQVQSVVTDSFTEEKQTLAHYSNLHCVLQGSCMLTFKGWLKLLLYFVLIPALAGWLVKKRINRNQAKKTTIS